MHPLEFDDTKDDLNISSLFAALNKISEERMLYYQVSNVLIIVHSFTPPS